MVLYVSTMVPTLAPKSSSDMLYERDTLGELMAKENDVLDDLENIRAYQFEGDGRIFGVAKQQQHQQQQQRQVQEEPESASQSSDSRPDGQVEGTDMDTDNTTATSDGDDDLDDGHEEAEDVYFESLPPYYARQPDDMDDPEVFW